MAKQHTMLIIIVATLMAATMAVLAQTASTQSAAAQTGASQTSGPSMTVSPQSGVRPLTVVVTGTRCATTAPPTGVVPHQIRVSWQFVDARWTAQTRIIADGQDTEAWTTTLVLNGFDTGVYLIEASCFDAGGQTVLAYPDQKVEVLLVPPVLSGSPTALLVGESFTATADQCPDPQGPILGGGYFVRFTLEYLIPPSGTEGPFSESTTVWTNQAGVASTIFTLPANAPTEGSAYRLSASCQLEELGSSFETFAYTPVAIQVSAQPDPTPDSNRYAATNCHTGANADTRAEPNASAHPDSCSNIYSGARRGRDHHLHRLTDRPPRQVRSPRSGHRGQVTAARGQVTVPAARRAAMLSASWPTVARISLVFSPRSGTHHRGSISFDENRAAARGWRSLPALGCSHSCMMSLCMTCG